MTLDGRALSHAYIRIQIRVDKRVTRRYIFFMLYSCIGFSGPIHYPGPTTLSRSKLHIEQACQHAEKMGFAVSLCCLLYVTVPGILSLMEVYGRNSDFYIL